MNALLKILVSVEIYTSLKKSENIFVTKYGILERYHNQFKLKVGMPDARKSPMYIWCKDIVTINHNRLT